MRVGALRLKIQVACGDNFALGPGKADLLAAIERDGSISAAGRALGMSYRRAWVLVDEMNRCFSEQLVETLSGGGRERGARLTDVGRLILAAYRQLDAAGMALAETDAYRQIQSSLRSTPVPRKADHDNLEKIWAGKV